MRVDVHVCEMPTPGDVSAVARLFDEGTVRAADVVAVVGKTEGTGLGNDQHRQTADLTIRALLGAQLGCTPDEVGERVVLLLSGGSPGVITPHVAVFVRTFDESAEPPAGNEPRLVAGTARSEPIGAEEVGRIGQIRKVEAAVTVARADAGLAGSSDVHLVLVKAPTLTAESVAEARSRGQDTVTGDLSIGKHGAICYSNDASALGVALALGECHADDVHTEMVRRAWSVYSDVAMTSSAGEKTHAEVLVLGNASGAHSTLRIGHQSMTDIVDASAVTGALQSAGVDVVDGDVRSASRQLVYALAKMIIPGHGLLNGRRITLLDDPAGYHVAKAMGGYLLASLTGHSTVFVSGGEQNSHQGPPDGSPLAMIVRV